MTKREKKATAPPRPQATAKQQGGDEQHIHCVACGRHLDPSQFEVPTTATVLQCEHKSSFAACVGCADKARILLAEHDKSGQPVKVAAAWH